MNSWFFFIMIIVGTISLLLFKNYLMMLISIELMMFSIYVLMLYVLNEMSISLDLLLIYMSMIIIEAVFGLCILINFSNSFGSDKFMVL